MIGSPATRIATAAGTSLSDTVATSPPVRIAVGNDGGLTFFQRRLATGSAPAWRRIPATSLRLYHQPIVSLKEEPGQLSGELLCRFRRADGSNEGPADFLHAAELCGLMPQFDRVVVALAIREAAVSRAWNSGRLCVNISAQTLVDPGFPAFLLTQLMGNRVSPTALCLEVTETSPIVDVPAAQSAMSALRAHGCQFALDDFGTGFASPDVLMRLPLDYVKIPGQFVEEDTPANAEVLRFIVAMAAHLRLPTIAEHVTSDAILQRMRVLGVDYVQGYAVGTIQPFAAAS